MPHSIPLSTMKMVDLEQGTRIEDCGFLLTCYHIIGINGEKVQKIYSYWSSGGRDEIETVLIVIALTG